MATYTYDTWGNCTVKELSSYTIGDLNPFRYRGYYWDAESGMYYLNSRYYSPEFGRFISADSELDNRGVITQNLFAYCGNNPVNGRDDDGNFVIAAKLVSGIVNGIIGGLSGALSAKAKGENVVVGAVVGAAVGAVTGMICGGLPTAVKGVQGLMASGKAVAAGIGKTWAVTTVGNVAEEAWQADIADTNNSDTWKQTLSNIDYGDAMISAIPAAAFAPVSMGNSTVLDDAFGIVGKESFERVGDTAVYGIAEGATSGNLSTLQTVIELCAGKEEQEIIRKIKAFFQRKSKN